jgi:hypothetical protein
LVNSENSDNYFDEAYFQRGWEKGTAYDDYLKSAASSPTFREIARCIATVFNPVRALEIGCATGAIVSELNALGVEAHGIDVSEWAIQNALHPHVLKASAEFLPYPDNHFDFIYSSHAMEHIPLEHIDSVLKEINRVSSNDSIQFHMLPIIGTYPYDYDAENARLDLKKDPTHNLLFDMGWWLDKWGSTGWKRVPISLNFRYDTENAELSSGQFCIIRGNTHHISGLEEKCANWNQLTFREIFLELKYIKRKIENPSLLCSDGDPVFQQWIGPRESQWDDIKMQFEEPQNLQNGLINGIINLHHQNETNLRIAIISDEGAVTERWLSIPPGISTFSIQTEDLVPVSGVMNLSRIKEIYFGGIIESWRVSANLSIHSPTECLSSLFRS